MNLIVSLILLGSSIAIFFGYIDPNYKGNSSSESKDYSTYGIVDLKNELQSFQDIDTNSKSIIAKRDGLIAKKNGITLEETNRLEKMLPSNIDNIRLIMEIDKIAQGRGLTINKNVFVGAKSDEPVGNGSTLYGTLPVSFQVTTTYANFLKFLGDLENNLRIIDITGISFTASDNGQYDFSVSLNTYWLK